MKLTKSDIAFLREFIADYTHLAPDADAHIDPHRKRNIERATRLLHKLETISTIKVGAN
jgi:hypothetical protein